MENIERNGFNVAEINIAKLKYPLNDPREAEFLTNLPVIYEVARQSKGFVWRYIYDTNEKIEKMFRLFNDNMLIVTLSVWETIDDAFAFVYKSRHIDFFRRKKEWFEPHSKANVALWRIEKGNIPTHEEGKEKLDLIDAKGPSQEAFNFKSRF